MYGVIEVGTILFKGQGGLVMSDLVKFKSGTDDLLVNVVSLYRDLGVETCTGVPLFSLSNSFRSKLPMTSQSAGIG